MNIKATHEDFVGVYDNAVSGEFCDSLIDYFEFAQKTNRTYGRDERESVKKDTSCNLNPTNSQSISFVEPNIAGFMGEFNSSFWDVCYPEYLKNYSVLSDYSQHTIYTYKIQKTNPGGGYHVWHSEDGDKLHSQRVGVYILYLNDVPDGGETEFLYFHKRVSAKKGRLVIFPPNYPWAHRGNPPLSGSKYIMTGWTEFT